MIKAIIVDDEQNFRDDLKEMLQKYKEDVSLEAECSSIDEAEVAINKIQPGLVFLDVELGPHELSFDLIKRISPINFEIIFTTAYNKYAIQAIRCSAIDYLLKPVDEAELHAAIEKYKNKNSKVDMHKIETLMTAWANPGNQQNKISLASVSGYDLITIEDIVFCEGISNQTSIVLKDDKHFLISKTLKECEEILLPYGFFRIHKSYLINLSYVKKFMKGKDGVVVLTNNKSLPVSRNFKDQFVELIRPPHSL